MHEQQFHSPRSPCKSTKVPSPLNGMEKSVRSFKSFVRSVPPNPSTDKPLPPSPADRLFSCLSPQERASSIDSKSLNDWQVPEEWLQSSLGNGVSPEMDFSQPLSISPRRTYSALLPEPSPDPSEMMDYCSTRPAGSKSHNLYRLTPIHERNSVTFSPPRSPPLSPLPALPISTGLSDVPHLRLQTERRRSRSGTRTGASIEGHPEGFLSLSSTHPLAPTVVAPPGILQHPIPRLSRGKALASLGLDNDGEPPSPVQTEHSRPMSTADEYHRFLTEQYRDLSLEDALTGADTANDHEEYQDLVPRPLSWRKGSKEFPLRKASKSSRHASDAGLQKIDETAGFRPNPTLTSDEPRRPSFVRRPKNAAFVERLRIAGIHPRTIKSRHEGRTGSMKNDRQSAKDSYRFSAFYPRSKHLKFKRNKESGCENESKGKARPSVSNSIAPTMHISSQLDVGRMSANTYVPPTVIMLSSNTTQRSSGSTLSSIFDSGNGRVLDFSNPQQPREGKVVSFLELSPTPPTSRSDTTEAAHLPSLPTSQLRQGSFGSNHATSKTVAGPRSSLQDLRSSKGSSLHSPQSSGSSYPTQNSQSSSNGGDRLSSRQITHSGVVEEKEKPGIIDRARDEWRKHNREVRQEKLKRSIKVLGPTDPSVVEEYVKREKKEATDRKPGYVIGKRGSGSHWI